MRMMAWEVTAFLAGQLKYCIVYCCVAIAENERVSMSRFGALSTGKKVPIKGVQPPHCAYLKPSLDH